MRTKLQRRPNARRSTRLFPIQPPRVPLPSLPPIPVHKQAFAWFLATLVLVALCAFWFVFLWCAVQLVLLVRWGVVACFTN